MSENDITRETKPPAEKRPSAPIRLGLRPREAAIALGMSERKLWSITANRDSGIPHARFDKTIIYPIRELRDWLAAQAAR